MSKYACNLSPELQEKSKTELNEDPKRRDEDIKMLREWLGKQKHIKGRDDDEFLLKFLRASKFSIETAKQKLDNYFTMKSAIPNWFTNLDISQPKLQSLLRTGLYVPIGYNDEGQRVLFFIVGAYDPAKYNADEVTKLFFMTFEYLLLDEQTQICGVQIVGDAKNVSPAVLGQFTPPVAFKMMTCWQKSMPLRIKGMHPFNNSRMIDTLIALFKRFMGKKLLDRVQVHGSNVESIREFAPDRILPKEYGGSGSNLAVSQENFVNEMNKLRDYFINEEKYKVDESKRPAPSKYHSDLMGTEGTFRNIDVD